MNIYFQKNFSRAFGTFPLKGDELTRSLHHAVRVGYRAIDTAQMYQNEAEVGAAIRSSGVARSELCITTKVHPDNFSEARFIPSVRESLAKLQIDQVDVLLLHWPPIQASIEPSLHLLEQTVELGLARHIGVSNYTAAMMHTASKAIRTPLVTNQVEFHPLLDQSILLRAACDTGIALSSYCSVARGEVFKYPLFAEIGRGYAKTAGQVVLRWILQKGVPINTMSTREGNIEANYDVMDFTLSTYDMARIDALGATGYRIVDKSLVPWAPQWD
jgi:2,5-diketo-D-gluconate reductase B